jgi:hypothetical protein
MFDLPIAEVPAFEASFKYWPKVTKMPKAGTIPRGFISHWKTAYFTKVELTPSGSAEKSAESLSGGGSPDREQRPDPGLSGSPDPRQQVAHIRARILYSPTAHPTIPPMVTRLSPRGGVRRRPTRGLRHMLPTLVKRGFELGRVSRPHSRGTVRR